MSDLISRKAVLEYLSELCETKDTSAYGLQLIGNYDAMHKKLAERDCVKNIINEIRDFDCAYDVDKVMEQLEEEWVDIVTEGDATPIHHWNGAIEKAIGIVKGAVKDE